MTFLGLLQLTCTSDPFQHMIRANKTYGFTIAVKELKETVPNIFRYASAYKRNQNLKSQGLWEMFVEPKPKEPEPLSKTDLRHQDPLPEEILSTEPGHRRLPDIDPEAMEGETYNMCHFWSNFEIARLDFFRSKEYEEFFETMDRSGGFWMERVRLTLQLLTYATANFLTVGRCSNPLIGSWGSPGSERYPLLPRFRLPTHHHPTLSSQRPVAANAAGEVS